MSDERMNEIRAQIEEIMKSGKEGGIVFITHVNAYDAVNTFILHLMDEQLWKTRGIPSYYATALDSDASDEEGMAMLRAHPEMTEEQRRQFWQMRQRDRRAGNGT